MPYVTNLEELAEALGVGVPTMRSAAGAGLPSHAGGLWDVEECRRWMAARARARASRKRHPGVLPDRPNEDRIEERRSKQKRYGEHGLGLGLTNPGTEVGHQVAEDGSGASRPALTSPAPLAIAEAAEVTLRWRRARAELVELEAKRKRGEVVERADLERELARRVGALRRSFLSLPELVSGLTAAQRQGIRARIRDILDAYARPEGIVDLPSARK